MHRCWNCQGVFVNYIFLTSPCQSPACIHKFFKKIHVCLVVHEYKHELPLKENPPRAWSHAADSCLPCLFLCTHLQRRCWWECPIAPLVGLSLLCTYTRTIALDAPHPAPQYWSWSAMYPHSSNTWEINQTLCWQPLTGKQEDGELHETSGIHDRYFHDWLKKEREIEGGKQGREGAVVFEGEKEVSF